MRPTKRTRSNGAISRSPFVCPPYAEALPARLARDAAPRYTADVLKLATLAAVTSVLAGSGAGSTDHAAEVARFARIMADVRTAAEVCKGVSPDWTVVNAAKEGLHIADVDYFAFRKEAHDFADGLEEKFRAEGTFGAWCSQAVELYGAQGTSLKGALRR